MNYSTDDASQDSLLADFAQSVVNSFPFEELVPSKLTYFPFYYADRPSLIPGVSDLHLSLAAPVLAYWLLSLFFHFLESSGLVDSYKIHDSEEMQKRNRVTPTEVVKAVFVQHVIQTVLGLAVLADENGLIDHRQEMGTYARWVSLVTIKALGGRLGYKVLATYGEQLVQFVYWWAVPLAQFMWASFVLDTWQYFLHRAFHTSKYLYKHIHSRHHRLYCPYAFGALYNHPFEGFLFDTLGGVIAHAGSWMNTRQAILLFTVSTIKTVDDHCNFNLPWDPCQFLWSNNAEYHDIHHQTYGLKKNFSQPYFTHWDAILGTRMTKDQKPKRAYTDQRDPLVQEGKAVPVMPNLKKDL